MDNDPTTLRSSSRRDSRGLLRCAATAWTVACVVALLGSATLLVAWRGFGLVPLAVQSGSMRPMLQVHALAFVHEVAPADVRVGDVITFTPPGRGRRVTHRVVARSLRNGHWYFRTKGDANPAPDDWRRGQAAPDAFQQGVTYGNRPALRYVFSVPQLGRLAAIGAHHDVRLLLVAAPFAALALQTLALIWRRPDEPGDGALDDDELPGAWWEEAA
jgi:signal peptidase